MSAKRIYVAGHKGMVGRALVSELSKNSNIEIVTASRGQLDLTNQLSVKQFFKSHDVDEVYLAAAKVGGNTRQQYFACEFHLRELDDKCKCD